MNVSLKVFFRPKYLDYICMCVCVCFSSDCRPRFCYCLISFNYHVWWFWCIEYFIRMAQQFTGCFFWLFFPDLFFSVVSFSISISSNCLKRWYFLFFLSFVRKSLLTCTRNFIKPTCRQAVEFYKSITAQKY